MGKWQEAYEKALEQTKKQVLHDIKQYFEKRDKIVSVEQYLEDRYEILYQIWMNSWVNKITTTFTLNEKKKYLLELGVIEQDLKDKLVKKIFRDVVKEKANFEIQSWLLGEFSNEGEWIRLFESIKHQQAIRKEKQKRAKVKNEVLNKIKDHVIELFSTQSLTFYIFLRYKLAQEIIRDLENNYKYKLVGNNWRDEKLVKQEKFQLDHYISVEQFLQEYTGEIVEFVDYGRMYYDFEQYGDRYGSLTFTYIAEAFFNLFKDTFDEIKHNYRKVMGINLSEQELIKFLETEFEIMSSRYFNEFCEEYIDHLLELIKEPFNIEQHRSIYEKHQVDRQIRFKKEEEERQRKQEEERKIIADVFEREFIPQKERPREYILHIGETNTGKTFHALVKLKKANSGCYLSPLRLLAIEVFDKLNHEGIACSLKTGEEEKLIPNAKHISCTVEMFHEKDHYDCLVIDEAQMLTDKERGFAWFKAITKANAKEVHIIGSRNSQNLLERLLLGYDLTIYDYVRETPLIVEEKPFRIEQAKKGDALICFSRKKVLQTASLLQRKGKKVSMIYGSMPPETRKAQVQRFIEGKTSVVVSTDAIGMGLNLPIRRVVFLENEKFDGIQRRRLSSQEVKQIAGRAGRKGIYNVGRVAFVSDIKKMKNLLEMDDKPLETFTIAPTSAMFERFKRYSHHLGTFIKLWKKFNNPEGTIKYSLTQEQELYQLIEGTEIERRLPLEDLYGFLHLPFSTRDKGLTEQWLETMNAIVSGDPLPEPPIKRGNLDDVEWTYKAIGLHLLFLYRLGKKTEAIYWERLREEISEEADRQLRITIKTIKKRCKNCGKELPLNYSFNLCNNCYAMK